MAGQGTDSELATLLKIAYDKRLVERLEPQVRLYQWADKRPIPMGEGNQIEFTGYRNNKPILSNSGEFSSSQLYLSSYKINKTLIQRHGYAQVSTILKQTSIDPKVVGAVDAVADILAKTVEVYIRKEVVGELGYENRSSASSLSFNTTAGNINTQGVYTLDSDQRDYRLWGPFPVLHNKARLGTSSAQLCTLAGSAATLSQIKHGVSFLRSRDVDTFEDGNYVFYCHPWVADALMADPTWKTWNSDQNSKETMWKGQVGNAFGASIVTSNMALRYEYSAAPLTTASGAMNFSLLLGKGAYAVSEITSGGNGQKGFEIIIHKAGSGGTSDPANLLNTVAGKTVMAAAVINKSSAAVIATTDKVVTSGT